MSREEEDVPEWLVHLEKPKVYKLGHEFGAGAPCLNCTYCPGLQFHFWRKVCMLCGCHSEDHDTENDDFSQYKIIFGDSKRRKTVIPFEGQPTSFDWVPQQYDDSVIGDYMSSLPAKWRPITGSLGGLYRKKQLGRQLPRYDVDPTSCLPLSDDEAKLFASYQTSLRQNAAGRGSIIKLGEGIYHASPAWAVETPTSECVPFSPQFAGELLPKKPESLGPEAKQLSYCHRCKLPTKSDEVVVLAAKMENSIWHASCFTCFICGELLVDLHYFYHDGKVYCGRDYAQATRKLRCTACDELIFEKEYTCAGGRFYHNRHFCCFFCDESLGGKQFLHKNDNIVCPRCYQDQFPKTCVTCQGIVPLQEQRVQVGSSVYHKNPGCFRCGVCKKSMVAERVFIRNLRILCSICSAVESEEIPT